MKEATENSVPVKLSAKQRLLKLQELLKKYTDEENELSLNQIIDKFYEETKIHTGKKAIHDDLLEIEKSGLFDVTINHEKNGVEKYYSHQNRLFEIHELRLMVDAVSSARFITNKETEKLIAKIEQLTSINQAMHLKNRILLSETVKNSDSTINITIHQLHMAISNSHVIRFQYGRYDLDKNFQLSRNGEYHEVKPYALVWQNEYYYLIGEFVPKGEIYHYRVDRMRNVSSSEETFLPDPGFNPSKYTGMLFHMYSGEEAMIEIEFDQQLINVVIDRFGRNINIRRAGEGKFRISIQAIISDGLVRWLLTWGSDAKVLTPPQLIERMKLEADKLYQTYH